jgi:maltose O-acetyltransferase
VVADHWRPCADYRGRHHTDHDYSWSVLKRYPKEKGIILGAQSPVSIGSNVFIGKNAIITRGVTIEDNVVIGTGSVVTKNCEANSVYAGNPARKIMTIEEYLQKRQQLQFQEAREMARIYRKRFGGFPPKEVFFEYFLTMFCSPEESEATPVFRSQMALCGNYDETLDYMKNHKPMFESYEKFLEACYLNDEK